ncbi:MAG: hypothetical protein GXP25_18620, partial [Planctomycetes bacterium]|nr:hypothetical protein [Planctomycetota bacterium]
GNSQSLSIGGYVNLLDLEFLGFCDTIRIGGYVTDSTLDGNPGLDFGFGRLRIGGYVDNTLIESASPVDQLAISGDVTNTVIQIFASARDIRIGGSMTDSGLLVSGSLDSLFITGNVVDTSPSIVVQGETRSCIVRGVVDTGQLLFQAQVDRLQVGGMWGAMVDVANGGVRSFLMRGDMDSGSVIDVDGFSGKAQLLGDVANGSTVTFNNGLDGLQISGMLDNSAITIVNGNDELNISKATSLTIGGGIWGTGVITVQGDCSAANIKGGMNDTASLNITGHTRRIAVAGGIAAGATVTVGSTFISASGQTYYTGTLDGMRVSGLIYGQVQVIGDLDTIGTSGATADPTGPSGPPYTGGFLTKDALGNLIGGRVDYVTLLPGGGVA